jgi:nicotinamidase-related amidase
MMMMEHSLQNHELREWYRTRGFGGRVGFGRRPAILAIDVARGWLDPNVDLGSSQEDVLDAVVKVLEAGRETGTPIFFTTMGFASPAEAGEVYASKLPLTGTQTAGTPEMQLHPAVRRRDDEPLIVKPRASAFFQTNLVTQLIARGIDTAVIVGLSTSGCIRATTESAFDYGFHAIVPHEAVGDRCRSAHEAALFDMDARLADVMPLDDVVAEIHRLAQLLA